MAALPLAAAFAQSQAQSSYPAKRVLILHGYDPAAPGVKAFTNALRGEVVRTEGTDRVEFYDESLDLDRFPAEQRSAQLASALRDKFRDFRFDAVIAAGSRALQFAIARLNGVFPDAPLLYGLAFEPVVDFDALPRNVTGVRQPLTFAGTLTLARRLQPDAERVFLISGQSRMDAILLSTAVHDLTPMLGNLKLVPMQDWTYQSLLEQVRGLPPRSIVIASSVSTDRLGQHFTTADMIASIARNSSVPVYGIARNWVGDGIVGGSVMAFGDDGLRVARLLVRCFRRRPGEPLPAPEVGETSVVVDARQLQRWGLSERLLPPGTEVLFRTPTVWSRYWPVIVAALAIMAAQSLLIAWMLLERGRRIRAQRVLEESRAQVAHIGRVATLGELAAAVSHELAQPLAAIRANAAAGARLVEQSPPNLSEAREIFRDIVEDDARAAEVLENIRSLLRKQEPARAPVDLNLVCTQATQVLHHDARRRDVRLRLELAATLPAVTGDAVQLQQVVLNLALNAMEAILGSRGDRKEVVVGTSAGGGSVEVFVSDTGPGLAPDLHQRIFEPFYSTKSQGLGMGLAIVRSIVDRHHGKVRVENQDGGGAIFRVQLPVDGTVASRST